MVPIDFSPPVFLSYQLCFDSTEDAFIFLEKLKEYSGSAQCCQGSESRLRAEYSLDQDEAGGVFFPGENDGCSIYLNGRFEEEPPDWFMEKVCALGGFDFGLPD